MAINQKIPWDLHMSVLLLDTWLRIESGMVTRKEAVAGLSDLLQKRAARAGNGSMDVYRNQNVISIQIDNMAYAATDGKKGMTCRTESFHEAVRLWRADKKRYHAVLNEAKGIPDQSSRTGRKPFIEWMQKQGADPASIISCVLAVEKCGAFASKQGLFSGNIMETGSPARADRLYQDLLGNEAFTAWNAAQSDRCRMALEQYVGFCHACALQEQEQLLEKRARDAGKGTSGIAAASGQIQRQPVPSGDGGATASATEGNSQPDQTKAGETIEKTESSDPEEKADKKRTGASGVQQSMRPAAEDSIQNGTDHKEHPEDPAGSPDETGETKNLARAPQPDETVPDEAPQGQAQTGLMDEIHTKIKDTFRTGATCICLEPLLRMYETRLAEELRITSENDLMERLLKMSGSGLCGQDGYIYMPEKKPYTKQDVIHCLGDSALPLTYQQIEEKLWYLPPEQITNGLEEAAAIVKVDTDIYFYAPNLPVGANELREITMLVKRQLMQKKFMTDTELKTLFDSHCPAAASRIKGFTVWGFRNALGYLLKNLFSFRGGIITEFGKKADMSEVFAQFGREHERLSIKEIKAFASEADCDVDWDALRREMIRISETEFLRNDQLVFDTAAIDAALEICCPDSYIPVKSGEPYQHFPVMRVEWNGFLLESYVWRFSGVFRLVHTEFATDDCCGVIVRKDTPFVDYKDVAVDFLAHSDAWGGEEEALWLLVEQGYQNEEIYPDTGQVIQEAKFQRALLKNVED